MFKKTIGYTFLLLAVTVSVLYAGTADDLKNLTGGHTRVAWIQDQTGGDANSSSMKVMGFDTEDGKGARVIVNTTGKYKLAILTPSGNRVVYTDMNGPKVYVADFSGANNKFVCNGGAADTWKDPATGKEWVVVAPNHSSNDSPVRRVLIDDPSTSVLLWDKTAISYLNFQLSGDGKKAGANLPWPKAGMATMNNVGWTQYGEGCYTSTAPDNSYYMWIFDNLHRNLSMYNSGGSLVAKVNINNAPGIKGWEVYGPSFCVNNKQFFVMTGPWSGGSTGTCTSNNCGNLIGSGGTNVEVYVGKFNSSLTGVTGYVQVTSNTKMDCKPSVWVGSAAPSKVQTPSISPDGGTHFDQVTVTLACGTSGATIRYTTNGSTPTSSSTAYSAPFTLTAGKTVKAKAFKSGMTDSDAASAAFTIQPASSLHLKVNAGPGSVSGWENDDNYVFGGNDFSFSESAVDLTKAKDPGPAALYQSLRHLGPSFTFGQVPNGDYTVRLHYKDGDDTNGGRKMVIKIEGQTVESAFNVRALAGAAWTAVVKEYNVTVADGNGLTVKYELGTGNDAFVCGIEVKAGHTTAIADFQFPIYNLKTGLTDARNFGYDLAGNRVDLRNVPAGVYLVRTVKQGAVQYSKITIIK